jgi:hypothetical protein
MATQPSRPPERVHRTGHIATPADTDCWCCGTRHPEIGLVRLGEHPEVAVCHDCAHYLHRRARRLRATGVTRRLHAAAGTVRDAVVERGWHEHRRIGPGLRWLDRHLPW